MKLVMRLFKAGHAELNDASLSVSNIHFQRKHKVQTDAKEIRHPFAFFGEFDNTFLILHLDEKIIQLMYGKTDDGLAIALSSQCSLSGKFVASPAISDGTGDTVTKCVIKLVKDFELLVDVHAFVFDTTASNTEQWKRSSTIFVTMLEQPLLWLACRHNIPELFIKHPSIATRGETKGSDDTLFKEFKRFFGFIDKRTVWKWPNALRVWSDRRSNEVLLWADIQMKKATCPREDYRELLELVVIHLYVL